ncbi:MAG: 2-dehydro-3-deoxygluconokinase [candidate division GAL15 bacterium]
MPKWGTSPGWATTSSAGPSCGCGNTRVCSPVTYRWLGTSPRASTSCVRRKGHEPSHAYYRAGSAASRLSAREVPVEAVEGARLLHTSGISQATSASAREAVCWAMERARRKGVVVSYDLNVRPKLLPVERFRVLVLETLPLVDLAFLSTEDARYVLGDRHETETLQAVVDAGMRVAVLKCAERGCVVATAEGERLTVPAWPVHAVGPTGAGDAFDAAFVVEWLAGRSLEEVARFANAVGALVTPGVGATTALPTREQVEAFLARHTGREA